MLLVGYTLPVFACLFRTLVASVVDPVHSNLDLRDTGTAIFTIDGAALSSTAKSLPTAVPIGSITAIPGRGLDVYFSDDLRSKLDAALAAHCSVPSSLECQQSLSAPLSASNLQANQLAPRADPLFIIAGVVSVVGILVAHTYGADRPVPAAIHITPAELSQVSNIVTATSVVAVSSGDSQQTTYSIPAKPTTASAAVPSITINPTTPDGLDSGDLHIFLSSDAAKRLEAIMNLPGTCDTSSNAKRSMSMACVKDGAMGMIYNSLRGATSYNNVWVNPPSDGLPDFEDEAYQKTLNSFLQEVEIAAPALGVTAERMAEVGTMYFEISFIYNELGKPLSDDNVLPGYYLTTGGGNRKCPPDAPKPEGKTPLGCQNHDCQGNFYKKLCRVGRYKDCECINNGGPMIWDDYNKNMMDLQVNALNQWLLSGGTPPGPVLECNSSPGRTGGALKGYASAAEIALQVPNFCKRVGDGVKGSSWSISAYYDSPTLDTTLFSVVGPDSSDAVGKYTFYEADCEAAFNQILSICDVNAVANPLGWTFGGEISIHKSFQTIYSIIPQNVTRPLPPPTVALVDCHYLRDDQNNIDFTIYGGGWADLGDAHLLPIFEKDIGPTFRGQDWSFEWGPVEGLTQAYEWAAYGEFYLGAMKKGSALAARMLEQAIWDSGGGETICCEACEAS